MEILYNNLKIDHKNFQFHEESGYPDLYLCYWIEIEPPEGYRDEDLDDSKKLTEDQEKQKKIYEKEAAKLKNTVRDPRNMLRKLHEIGKRYAIPENEELKADKLKEKEVLFLTNEQVEFYYDQVLQIYCPDRIIPENVDMHYIKWKQNDLDVSVIFYRIKNKSLFNKCEADSNEDKSLLTAIHRTLTFMNQKVEDDDESFKYTLDDIKMQLDKGPEFYKTKELENKKNMKSNLFSYQLHNVNNLLESEKNPCYEIITDDDLFPYEDGVRIYNYFRDEDTTYDELPKEKIKGRIIMDDPGTGKTICALSLIEESNFKRRKENKNELKTICLVPNHLKNSWHVQIEEHFENFNHELTKIITFAEFLQMEIKEGDYDRLIVDEIHELYSKDENSGVYDKTIKLKFEFKHGLTGTPFAAENSGFYLIKYLSDCDELELDTMDRFTHIRPLYFKLFSRNIIANISKDVVLPNLKEHNEILNFSHQEKVLYNSELAAKENTDELFLRKLCCDVMLNFKQYLVESMTQKQFEDTVLAESKRKYELEEEKRLELENIVNALLTMIEHLSKDKEKNMIRIMAFEEQKKIHKKKLEDQTKITHNKLNSYQFVLEQFKDVEKICPLCMDILEENQEYNMLPCGHVYCPECSPVILNNKSCDVCRRPIEGSTIKISAYSEKIANNGTKINKLINMARELTEKMKSGSIISNKIVVYSQFPDMLERLIETLNIEGLQTIMFKDTNDIMNFKENKNIQCLVISSNKNASGIDLSFASNIVIYEPIKGDKLYLREIERQIIGRVFRIGQIDAVNVHRFIINDTIEKKIYEELLAAENIVDDKNIVIDEN